MTAFWTSRICSKSSENRHDERYCRVQKPGNKFSPKTAFLDTLILREVYKDYTQQCALWIQKPLSYDNDLSGTPDYMIATRSMLGKTVLGEPLLIIVEANDFEQGWGQCLAELVTAQKINGDTHLSVHGIVTDGRLWELGKLTADTFAKNITGYTVDHLPQLFGALHFVLQSSTAAMASLSSR